MAGPGRDEGRGLTDACTGTLRGITPGICLAARRVARPRNIRRDRR
jgi:hypothetical protein